MKEHKAAEQDAEFPLVCTGTFVGGWDMHYPTNAHGHTYGSAAEASDPHLEPDLIAVMAPLERRLMRLVR